MADLIAAWMPSRLTESQIGELVQEGFLPEQSISQFRAALKQLHPTEETEEITVFKAFYEVGFGAPCSDFFRCLLEFYGVELHHLNPIFLLHISVFIHLCEAFLGIDLHFNLFRHLFRLKITANASLVVGKAGVQFKQGMKELCINYPTSQSVKKWNEDLFYVKNHDPQLTSKTNQAPVAGDHWFKS